MHPFADRRILDAADDLYPHTSLRLYLRVTTQDKKDKKHRWFLIAEVRGWVKGEWKVLMSTNELQTHSRQLVVGFLLMKMRIRIAKDREKRYGGSKEGKKPIVMNKWLRKKK